MAKIVTSEEQKSALHTIVTELKNLSKLKKVLQAEGTECKISFTLLQGKETSAKASYFSQDTDAHALIAYLYKQKAKLIRTLIEENHIEIELQEKALLDFAAELRASRVSTKTDV